MDRDSQDYSRGYSAGYHGWPEPPTRNDMGYMGWHDGVGDRNEHFVQSIVDDAVMKMKVLDLRDEETKQAYLDALKKYGVPITNV